MDIHQRKSKLLVHPMMEIVGITKHCYKVIIQYGKDSHHHLQTLIPEGKNKFDLRKMTYLPCKRQKKACSSQVHRKHASMIVSLVGGTT